MVSFNKRTKEIEMGDISQYLANISIFTYAAVFIGGVAASFTPCVFPLIPIIVGVIGSSKESSKLRNFLLSLSYCAGMALTFSILGMLAALTGKLFGQLQSSPLAHIIVGNIIIFFGLALVDVVPLPTFLLSKAGVGKIRKGGGGLGAFLMGFASGFVAAPCTAAVLAALLTYVATTQNVIIGGTLLFTFAVGLSTLLILIGTFTGILAAIPKSEKVMVIMQKVLAFAMILLGEFFIFRAGLLSL